MADRPKQQWHYLVPKPERGQVRACPLCGCVAVFQCFHDHTGSIKTMVMNANRAAALRRNSGEYKSPQYACDGCGYKGPLEAGATIGHRYLCAECSGRTPRQVRVARRQVR